MHCQVPMSSPLALLLFPVLPSCPEKIRFVTENWHSYIYRQKVSNSLILMKITAELPKLLCSFKWNQPGWVSIVFAFHRLEQKPSIEVPGRGVRDVKGQRALEPGNAAEGDVIMRLILERLRMNPCYWLCSVQPTSLSVIDYVTGSGDLLPTSTAFRCFLAYSQHYGQASTCAHSFHHKGTDFFLSLLLDMVRTQL